MNAPAKAQENGGHDGKSGRAPQGADLEGMPRSWGQRSRTKGTTKEALTV
jgi:hypothetical protein